MKLFPVFFLLMIVLSGIFFGCKKFLDVAPGNKYTFLDSLNQIQVLLDNEAMRYTPTLPELSTTSYYLSDASFNERKGKEHNAYIWNPEIFTNTMNDDDWSRPYNQVYNCNRAMSRLNKISADDSIVLWNALYADAFYKRAYAFFHVVQVFALAYDPQTARTDLGIPLRLNAETIETSTRASVQETYDQILSDLRSARALLPRSSASTLNSIRVSLPAIMAMMARVYLTMNDYAKAGMYADSCLSLYDTLVDYNLLPVNSPLPFKPVIPEVIYLSYFHGNTAVWLLQTQNCIVDSTLFRSYSAFDLRRTVFYQVEHSLPHLKGSYSARYLPFSGLSVGEMYLIRAEYAARSGNHAAALNDLNTLLRKRWQTNRYESYTLSNVQDVLQLVLTERKKELAFRGIEWSDIRRLNKMGAGIVLSRTANGRNYKLQPNSNWYALPIPPAVIEETNMIQNPR